MASQVSASARALAQSPLKTMSAKVTQVDLSLATVHLGPASMAMEPTTHHFSQDSLRPRTHIGPFSRLFEGCGTTHAPWHTMSPLTCQWAFGVAPAAPQLWRRHLARGTQANFSSRYSLYQVMSPSQAHFRSVSFSATLFGRRLNSMTQAQIAHHNWCYTSRLKH